MISRYQKGSRRPYLIERVTGIHKDTGEPVKGRFKLSNKARTLLLSGQLHKVSPKCCEYLKKRTAHKYEKETGKKPILGVRGSESALRSVQYKKCFTKSGTFTPLYNLKDDMLDEIYKRYNIEVPEIYSHISRSGCMGCPYGSWKGDTELELKLVTKAQRKFLGEYFKESYQVLGIDIERIKQECGDYDEQKL